MNTTNVLRENFNEKNVNESKCLFIFCKDIKSKETLFVIPKEKKILKSAHYPNYPNYLIFYLSIK